MLMAKSSIQNMTEGNPTTLLLKFSLPMIIGNIFQQLYNMVDSIIVGQFVGSNALAAVGATGSIIFLFFSLAFGVAIATGIAELCSAIGAVVYAWRKIPLFRMPRREFVIDRSILIKSLNIGVPVALQSALIAFSCVVLQRVVNGFGPTIVAAYTAASRFEQLVHQPFNSLGTAISTYTGQNIGAGNLKRIKAGHWAATRLNIIFCLIMLPVAYFGGEAIMRLFTTDVAVIEQGVIGIRITCFFYVALGMIYVSRSVLNGAGDTKFAMVLGISEVVCRVSLAKPLTLIPAIGMLSIWYTTGLTWLAVGTLSTVRYARGKWKTKGVVNVKAQENQLA